ncbi:VOC family protein [Paenibacillus mucilaginosus]|uniref:VOC domain-containing protein n=1 Tax=Paenibacillus mucilaginosus (strain KNP414) TaxID=1036673 RepID=F8FG46_PAEMK|nr:VOC family protein [Paenibacillus mucilaginosus]AEI43866.1 hypothetical protein KNP414_05342 [Paenibacillus mucilaginosus KNP414]MCG7212625.1 extradiol dioxygenase [Paenibacillus mucilaginosus]WDM25352.1 extradiol dioxygenase [Paenibacillus mucilaginosus]
MNGELWINLSVKDLEKAKAFYSAAGFALHPRHEGSRDAAGLLIGEKKVTVMLFPEEAFEKFAGHAAADPKKGSEVLLSIGAASREEVDGIIRRAVEAGGTCFCEPKEEQGWMYGAGFADVDGHRWNILYMDMSRMPSE